MSYTTLSLGNNLEHREEFKKVLRNNSAEYIRGLAEHSRNEVEKLSSIDNPKDLTIEYIKGYKAQELVCLAALKEKL